MVSREHFFMPSTQWQCREEDLETDESETPMGALKAVVPLAVVTVVGCARSPDQRASEGRHLPRVGSPPTASASSPAAERIATAKEVASAVRRAHDPGAVPKDFLALWEQALDRGPISTGHGHHSIYIAAHGDLAAAIAVPQTADARFLIGIMWEAARQAFNVNLSRARQRGGPPAWTPEVVRTRYGDAARFPMPEHTYYIVTVKTERAPRRGWIEARTFVIWREPAPIAQTRSH
jgi:hypothetical protein